MQKITENSWEEIQTEDGILSGNELRTGDAEASGRVYHG